MNSSEEHMLLDLSTQNGVVMSESQVCYCHKKDDQNKKNQRKAVIKLLVAIVIGTFFMTGEAIGGYAANSLAVMTDALHMLIDVTSFVISLFAIWLGRRKPSKYMTFGWKRAEVLGALLSVLMIYGISGGLIYEATKRVKNPDSYELNPDIMLIVSCGGVFINVVMLVVLHQGGHGHSHGGHSHVGYSNDCARKKKAPKPEEVKGEKKGVARHNINVTAASIHVIGDFLQTLGVLITSYIVWFRDDWKIADPICTYIFGILIVFTTCRIMFDILRVIMEGVPSGLNVIEVGEKLCSVKGVVAVHSLCIWSINVEYVALAAHLAINKDVDTDNDQVLKTAVAMLKDDYSVSYTALQLESYQSNMKYCKDCKSIK